MKKIGFLVILLLINLTSAIDYGKEDVCYNIIKSCDNCSYINASTIKLPNQEILTLNKRMTELSDNVFNYSFCNTSDIGIYKLSYCGDEDGGYLCNEYSFKINSTGDDISLINIILVIAFLTISVIIFFIGNTFKPEQFLLRTSFYLFSILFGILAINSARIIASESLGLKNVNPYLSLIILMTLK